MAARKRNGLSENTRKRIQTSMIVDRVQKHILGEIELSATQLRAAEILIRKTLPDLTAVELSGYVETNPSQMSDEQIIARMSELRAETSGADTVRAALPAPPGPKLVN